SLGILNTDTIQQEIEIALETTLRHSCCSSDHLCCGNFGRLALLTMASQTLERPELLTMARGQAASLIARAAQVGNYQLFLKIPNKLNLSFFQGMAGIGYQLLRLAQPESTPEVLLWQ
ncbi:MAG TPA: lanthionine synthetase LanC family protein, partial [Candidatus Caenarcaniphilales bacterium]